MPQTFSTGRSARNRCSSRPGIAVSPEGLAHLDAIFATTLLGARPTENVNPSSASSSLLIRSAGTHLRRDTVIPQWFQASKAAAASDGHAVHFWVTAVIFQLSRLKRIPHVGYLEACEQILSALRAGFAELFGEEPRDEPDLFDDHED